jgi:hypothetical protein
MMELMWKVWLAFCLMNRYITRRASDTFLGAGTTTIGVFSLWTHTMNRCYSFIRHRLRHEWVHRIAHRILLALLVVCVGALVSFPHTTLAQSMVRPFPADAKRGVMEVQAGPSILINGAAERLSPGARIRGVNNLVVMSGQLIGQKMVVNYTRDTLGSVHQVWVLTSLEASQERAGSELTTGVLFGSPAPKSNSYSR